VLPNSVASHNFLFVQIYNLEVYYQEANSRKSFHLVCCFHAESESKKIVGSNLRRANENRCWNLQNQQFLI
jgi:hypothetical protein